MLFTSTIARAIALSASLYSSVATANAYHGPKSCNEFRDHHPYRQPPANHCPKIYIRQSKSDTDDVSAKFLHGLKKANHGGTLVLAKGQTFVIGNKLDLTFLNDIQVNLEGETLVSMPNS